MSEQAPEEEVPQEDAEPQSMEAAIATLLAAAGGGVAGLSAAELAELIRDTSSAVSGRVALTGEPFSGNMPAWVVNDPQLSELAGAPQGIWDPYLGFDDMGDERVFMGTRKPRVVKEEAKERAEKSVTPWAVEKYGEGYMPPRENVGKDGQLEQIYDPEEYDRDWWMRPPTVDEIRQAGGFQTPFDDDPESGGLFSGLLSGLFDQGDAGVLKAKMEFWYGPDWRDEVDIRTGESEQTKPVKVANERDKTMTMTQVANLPYTWSEQERLEAMTRMRQAGLKVTTFDEMVKVWNGLTQRAAMTYSLSEGAQKVTPWDVLDMHKTEAQTAGSFVDYESGSQSSTVKSVAEITEGAAFASMQSTLSKMLGRDPTDQEVRDFAYRMNQLAAKNPAITKIVQQYKAGEVVDETRTTTGGFNEGDMFQSAYEDAQSDPEYAEYQSATTYFNAAMSALGAIGDV